jgi:arylformamidase
MLPLDAFIGPCVVIDMTHVERLIDVHHLSGLTFQPRVLFKTKNDSIHLTAISKACIDYLAKQGVRLVGTSSLSIDSFDSKTLSAHHACYQNHIHIVERLELNHVTPGVYHFIGLPLKLRGVDASPVRAVLIML